MTTGTPIHGLLETALPKAYVAAFRILGDRDEARDACHDAARKALVAGASYDRSRPFYPWFRRIVKNCCLDRIGVRKGDRSSPMLVEPADAGPGAEEGLLDRERGLAVARAVLTLPDELRAVIELRHFEDASYRDIAEALGLPEGTVMSRLFRARRALREALSIDPAFSRPEAPAGRSI